MHLTRLSLTNFRAFTRLDMDVPRRLLLLVGDNAQGKTSVLEAVYYLATFTSLQAQADRQLVNFMASDEPTAVARLVAEYMRGERRHKMEVRLILDSTAINGSRLRKEILVDGVKRPAHEAMGAFNAVIFLPQMTRIIEEGPDERRRYLNLALSQAVPGYALALSEYNQVVTQRNALLKQMAERGSADGEQLSYWDELLAQRGAFLIHARISAVEELERLAARVHHRLTHSEEILRMVYQPSYDPLGTPEGQYSLPIQAQAYRGGFSREQIQKGFLTRLAAVRGEEIARGVTTIGPHRDEMRFLANGIDLGDFGSRGQVRTALLALKLAEVGWLQERTGQWPVLLLDEILAELDTQRRADLQSYLRESEQVLMTTTDLKLFEPEFVQQSTVWNIDAGCVTSTL
ncbi:MAG TPA: DNA replication and repair protein RecF [Anaerolineaceae bacterium]